MIHVPVAQLPPTLPRITSMGGSAINRERVGFRRGIEFRKTSACSSAG